MQLKLAEYNLKTGKFERFLELATFQSALDYPKFVIGKDFIFLCLDTGIRDNEIEGASWLGRFKKDEKDPLNRFNGLFDGRTYGEGRFVLMRGYVCHCCGLYLFWEDKIYFDGAKDILLKFNGIRFDPVSKLNLNFSGENIHEKPELWEKVR